MSSTVIASMHWVLGFADFCQAFHSGGPLRRKSGELFCELPSDGIPGVPKGSLIQLLKHC